MNGEFKLDLVALVADADQREVFRKLLNRHESFDIQALKFKVLTHPRRDAGVFRDPIGILRPFLKEARYSLVVLDHQGSGQESRSGQDLTDDLIRRLSESGWGNRVGVLVIQPELEAWVWSSSPHVESVLGWQNSSSRIRQWLEQNKLWPANSSKPQNPKDCLVRVLRETRVPRSAALYGELAENVSLSKCADPAFMALRTTLQRWFLLN